MFFILFLQTIWFSISNVKVVQDGNKCLEIIHSNKEDNNENNDYDIFIVDTHLPDVSGFEIARKIRDNYHIKE